MSTNATGRLPEKPAQKLIHDHHDVDRGNSTPGELSDPGPFTEWLRHQAHRGGGVGALAQELRGDGDAWPEPVTYQDAYDLFKGHDAPWFVIAALGVAWTEWAAIRRAARRRSR